MKEVRLGIIGVNGRGCLWRYWHNPAEGVTVAAGADISQDSITIIARARVIALTQMSILRFFLSLKSIRSVHLFLFSL